MSGLNLRGANSYGGSPATSSSFTAVPASPPSVSGTTLTQQAYGTAPSPGPQTAYLGTVITGVAGVLVLLFVWHSLPR